ncbi:MAG: iron-containing alcohol dehydrogenase, partial [Clostridia bacterium]|nr:iron-containing alcohol dehydrogenase [Clostridia bacterium]
MNVFKAAYCRMFQSVFKIALPVLPYKNPKIIDNVKGIADVIKANGKRKLLLVTDSMIYSLGLCATLEDSLKAEGVEYCVYSDVVANPTSDNVDAAVKVYKENGCDCLIAFGGGSAMDCAKGVGALIARPKKTLNDLGGILKVKKKIPMLIAVPTTAGTGSETTLACVVVDSETRHKYAINDFPLIPSYAVLDEEVTMSLPPKVVSTTGMDALTHAIEAYIGKSGNKSTRRDALEAIDLIFNNLENSYFEKTREARKNMLLASHKAGRAFSKAYVGYVHAVAHSLGGKYDTPHGLA